MSKSRNASLNKTEPKLVVGPQRWPKIKFNYVICYSDKLLHVGQVWP